MDQLKFIRRPVINEALEHKQISNTMSSSTHWLKTKRNKTKNLTYN